MIYFIEAPSTGLIKIGSAANPIGRLRDLGLMSPVPLRLIATMDGKLGQEFEAQDRFPRLWCHGEWFRSAPELRAFIAENATPWVERQPVRQPRRRDWTNSKVVPVRFTSDEMAVLGRMARESGLRHQTAVIRAALTHYFEAEPEARSIIRGFGAEPALFS